MSLTLMLKKIYLRLWSAVNTGLDLHVNELERILNSYPEPQDDIERSYFQYRITMDVNGKIFWFLVNLASVFLIPYYILNLRRNYKKLANQGIIACDGVFLTNGIIIETIPDSLRIEFPNIVTENFTDTMCLSHTDIMYLKEIFLRYPTSFHFYLKCIIKVGILSAQRVKHNPKSIISYTEGGFTSSVATNYCERYGMEHINIMHGERYFELHASFFRFSRFYVWDQHYIDLFKSLRAPVSQFIIELPQTLKRNLCKKENQKYYMTYYLSDEKEDALLLIKDCFEKLKKQGRTCAIRMHPRWSNYDLVRKIFKGYDIEEAKIINIKQSLENTEHVASLRSTVLFEGYCNGKAVILDDYSNKKAFERIKDLNYIMLKKPHKLLSQVLKEE